MTKDKISDNAAEMNATSVVNSSNVRQSMAAEEDVIISCQEKVRQVMNCCQDVVRKLDSVHEHLASDRTRQRMMPLEEDCSKADVRLLEEKLRLSSLRINELELVEITVRRKIDDLEGKVQALMAQLMVYKEDFDLERKDREVAHGRIAELEQMLQRARGVSSVVQNSYQRLPHHCLYQSFDLVARGHDVCDVYQTDGVPDVDEQRKTEMPTEAQKTAGFIDERMQDPDQSGSSMQLVARSFDIGDFFPSAASSRRAVAPPEHPEGARGELSADGAEAPTVGAVTFSSKPSRRDFTQIDRCGAFPLDVGVLKPDFVTTEPSVDRWSFLSKNPEDFRSSSYGGINLDETDCTVSVIPNEIDKSKLICPKCRRSFSLYDHCRFLDHLEEC